MSQVTIYDVAMGVLVMSLSFFYGDVAIVALKMLHV